ncbi:MAG: type II toxin-antitoxin system PemK/MazF family toxin [Verrucomicrobiota bacterium]
MKIERYGIYWVDLNPVIGSEMAKTRPAIVVSDDLMNQNLDTIVVCPLTSQIHPAWRSRIQMNCAGQSSEIAVDQIRTISRRRLRRKIDQANAETTSALRSLIVEMYGSP